MEILHLVTRSRRQALALGLPRSSNSARDWRQTLRNRRFATRTKKIVSRKPPRKQVGSNKGVGNREQGLGIRESRETGTWQSAIAYKLLRLRCELPGDMCLRHSC
jgi:hypothetical protein